MDVIGNIVNLNKGKIMSNLKDLVKEFIGILDEVEESNSGKEFHPVYISSCRVMKSKRIGELLTEMKELTEE